MRSLAGGIVEVTVYFLIEFQIEFVLVVSIGFLLDEEGVDVEGDEYDHDSFEHEAGVLVVELFMEDGHVVRVSGVLIPEWGVGYETVSKLEHRR